MTIQQLEYIIAVDVYRHFSKAADACFVTQPTLSMMIQKLEDELNVKIFDRNVHPIVPTQIGTQIINQAKETLKQVSRIKDIINISKNEVRGEFRLGIIPTIAPYLLPIFLPNFLKNFPDINLKIIELQTSRIKEELEKQNLDGAILATPLFEKNITEYALYYERFFPYVSPNEDIAQKEHISPNDIDPEKLWILKDGHCFRSQVLRLCEIKKIYNREREGSIFEYESGSLETLMLFVEQGQGLTVIPELAANQLHPWRKSFLRAFCDPVPVREVSLVTHVDCAKLMLVRTIAVEIQKELPLHMKDPLLKRLVVDID
ncbi:LysR family transcriptional regulator [Bacteroidales bacterium OttesenSCG-928-C19]|nr:LysR family transcriptional regulator [Bacteroidales bacterium OttesenSCG-928-C19]